MYLDCLLARAMKAKCYQNSEFLKAVLGSHPSYTWRSIWSVRGLLEEGMGWRNEEWLPGPRQGKITDQDINVNFTTITDLINSDHSTWRLEVLEKLFDEDQKNRIMTILVVGVDIMDVRVWKGDNTSEYTAKNRYKWLLTEDTTTRDATLSQTTLYNFYNRLWNLQLTSKIKFTLWKVINNYIPTFNNLQARRLMDLVNYIFWECLISKSILQEVGIETSPNTHGQNWKIWLANVFTNMEEEQREYLAIALWGEKMNRQESTSTVKEIATSAGLYNSMWSPPRANTIKCNFDAAYNNYLLKLVMGIMFRDSEGLILALCTYHNPFNTDTTTMEVKTCLQAVTVAEAPSSDASKLDKSNIVVIVHKIKERTRRFETFTCSFVGRSANQATHEMVEKGKKWPDQRVWIEEAPHRVEMILRKDRRPLNDGWNGSEE
ncbi:hypothetical protein ES288_D03G113500v1 [Gossypium darwinii]|uniref:RNase H type-1 domain-containing protein n=1 Tax=Gossypium darwinii TaxID=34276 RepID=A0A5D2D7Y6_GOSDA|nr:hypothetical protein ES288_D03G113500v1 [Gossypium darwinii]